VATASSNKEAEMELPKVTFRGFFRDTRQGWEMFLGGIIAIWLVVAATNLGGIARNLGENTIFILVLAACYTLYLVRYFFRLVYGTVESFIGIAAIFGLIQNTGRTA
jgi:hypothetical protein